MARGYADEAPSASDNLQFSLTCPHEPVFVGEVASVNIPAIAGELSIMSGSLPTITELNAGVVSVQNADGGSSEYFVSPGFALKSKENSLTVSVAEAFPVADLDPDAVEQVGFLLCLKRWCCCVFLWRLDQTLSLFFFNPFSLFFFLTLSLLGS